MMIMNKLFFSLAILSILIFSCSGDDTSSQGSQLQVVTNSEKLFSIDDFYNTSSFVSAIENRQGLKIGSPEEAAWRMGWISDEKLYELGEKLNKSDYGKYLQNLIEEPIIKQSH